MLPVSLRANDAEFLEKLKHLIASEADALRLREMGRAALAE
jgi:hypothetical protein